MKGGFWHLLPLVEVRYVMLDCEIMLNVMTTLNTCSLTVDKTSKTPKAAGTTAGRIQLHSPAGGNVQTEEEEEKDLRIQNEKKSQCILQLRKLIANGNRRLEALALVVQHVFREVRELIALFSVLFNNYTLSILLYLIGFSLGEI